MSFYKEAYRVAGVSYLNYVNICGRALRQSMKEPFRSDHILKADLFRYKWMTYGKNNARVEDEHTNYTDEELVELNAFVNEHKSTLEAREETAAE